MGHSNSKSSQKLAVCQWCILQQMSQNFSAESFQCESLAYLSLSMSIVASTSTAVSTLIFMKRDVTQ